MAINDIEVEIKVKITKNKFEKLKTHLNKIAKFKSTSHHIDTYYSPIHKSFLKPQYPFEWLSIRERSGRTMLNYKHWYPEGAKDTTHCDEYETEITNPKQMEKIFNSLNIQKIITVDKKRETYVYKNNIEIALDTVKNLGYFIEVESLNNKGGIEKTYWSLQEFMKSLGINKTTIIPGGYAAEMMRKKGLMKTY